MKSNDILSFRTTLQIQFLQSKTFYDEKNIKHFSSIVQTSIRDQNKTQGFRVELQVSGRGGEVTGKGQDFDKTGTRQ